MDFVYILSARIEQMLRHFEAVENTVTRIYSS